MYISKLKLFISAYFKFMIYPKAFITGLFYEEGEERALTLNKFMM